VWKTKIFFWMTSVVNWLRLQRRQIGPNWALFCLIGLCLSGCERSVEPVSISGPTMGTSYHVTISHAAESFDQAEVSRGIQAELDAVNQAASTYIPDSELMRFNNAPLNEPIKLSKPLFDLFVISEEVHQLTNGAYDVTVGPVVNLWGFGPDYDQSIPDDEKLSEALAEVGFEKLTLNKAELSVRKSSTVEVDLSSVAKGFAVDQVANYLESKGLNDYLVEVGGEIRVKGLNPKNKRWRIGIESPVITPSEPAQAIELTDVGMATSGDYRNFFTVDGVRYSHTIDPRTGRPITHNMASITVIDKTSARADALATGLNVMGYESAQQVCAEQHLACFFILHDGDNFIEESSPEFAQFSR